MAGSVQAHHEGIRAFAETDFTDDLWVSRSADPAPRSRGPTRRLRHLRTLGDTRPPRRAPAAGTRPADALTDRRIHRARHPPAASVPPRPLEQHARRPRHRREAPPDLRKRLRGQRIGVRIARKGIESSERLDRRRWVIEPHTMPWLSGYRRLSPCHERDPRTYPAFLGLAALCCYQRTWPSVEGPWRRSTPCPSSRPRPASR